MLPHAKYRHYDHRTVSHTGVTGVTTPSGRGLHHPPNQTTWHPSLKSFLNKGHSRFQKVNIASRPVDKTVEDTCWPGSDSRIYFGQHPPPPIKEQVTLNCGLWTLNWQHPPPLQKSGESPPGLIRTKDPPPKHTVNSLLCRGLLSHLMRPDITAHAHRIDRLTLASEHPPPTKGQVTVNRARWKVNWQQPPPTTRGVARNLIAAVTNLRSISLRLKVLSITVQGNITSFLIEAGAAPYYQKFLYPQRTYLKIKQLHHPVSFVLSALLVTMKAVMSRAIYNGRKFAYLTGLEEGSMLTSPINQNRQILPSYTEFNDHVCLVGNICLGNKSRTRKKYIP